MMASSTLAGEQVSGPEPQQQQQQQQTKADTRPSEPSLDGCIESLIVQWQACIEELQRLQLASETSTTPGAVSRPVRGLNALLKVQQRALDKAAQKHQKHQKQLAPPSSQSGPSQPGPAPAAPTISQAQYFGIKSCCWEDRWAVVKKCRGLVAINKDFPRSPRLAVAPEAGWLAYKDQPFQERPVAVDAVVDSGATWIKFISISAKTLEYQVVAEGWASESEDEDEEGDGDANGNADDGLSHTEFADAVKKIILAARWNHCRRVHLILPGLHEGKSELVDRMLRYVRNRIGGDDVAVEVSCADSPFLTRSAPPLDDAITALIQDRDGLVGDDCGRLTDTINLDPSALVALATDLHHGPVPLQPESQQRIITQSILDHETDNNNELVSRQDILPMVLYPALRGRKLVCTASAAAYFRKLIDAISTHSEETRAALVLPSTTPLPTSTLLSTFQQWSTIPVPPDLHLPVEIVPDLTLADIPPLIASHDLPPMALGVATDLSPLNRAVYLHGWARRITTVTGHRGIERQVRLSLAQHWTRDGADDERPPDIWHRHLGGYLIHRDKPKEWRAMVPDGEVPAEVVRWTNPWTTWGRGISTYGLPDTKTWEGVGHEEKTSYGRRMDGREGRAAREEHEEQS